MLPTKSCSPWTVHSLEVTIAGFSYALGWDLHKNGEFMVRIFIRRYKVTSNGCYTPGTLMAFFL